MTHIKGQHDGDLHHPDGTHRTTPATALGSKLVTHQARLLAHLAGHERQRPAAGSEPTETRVGGRRLKIGQEIHAEGFRGRLKVVGFVVKSGQVTAVDVLTSSGRPRIVDASKITTIHRTRSLRPG